MKHLIFSALIGCIPYKENQKEPVSFKSAFVAEDKKKRIAKIILNLRGKHVNIHYKGKVYIIYEDFTEKSIINS